jgi:glycine oxidase
MRVGWNQVGETTVIGTDDDPRILQDLMEWQQQHGMNVQWLDGAALREHEPVLADDVGAAVYDPDAGSLRVHLLSQALARAAAAHGATIREYTPVTGIASAGGRVTGVRTEGGVVGADIVVLAAGAWSHALGEMTGVNVPTRPVHGQMLSIADPPTRLRTIVAGFGAYILPRADGTIAAGATQEEIGFRKRVTPNGVNELIGLIDSVAPSLNNGRLVETWSGLRPGNPDGRAIIGPAPGRDGLWIATGHFRGGALLAAATSELVAASILHGAVDPLLAEYSPARFG